MSTGNLKYDYNLSIINDFTGEIYNKLVIKNKIDNKDEIVNKLNFKYVLYSPTTKKYLKSYRVTNVRPLFTDYLENAMTLNCICDSYKKIQEIFKYLESTNNKYVTNIVGDLFNRELHVCKIEFNLKSQYTNILYNSKENEMEKCLLMFNKNYFNNETQTFGNKETATRFNSYSEASKKRKKLYTKQFGTIYIVSEDENEK
ncbi:MAG: hypothetical protein ACRC5M_04305 [Anaeroplasmataceae bacterium]